MALDKEQLDALRIDPQQRVNSSGTGRIALWTLFLGIFVVGVWLGLKFWRGNQPPAQPPLLISEALSPKAANSGVLDASGYVVARRLATVSSKVTGRIDEVFIEEGMTVKAGDLLARLDASSVTPQLQLAQSQHEAARKGMAETQVRLDEARRQLARSEQLRAQKLVSESTLETAQAEVDALMARLSVSRSNVEVALRTVALREQDIADLEIRAPFSGVIVAKNAQPGEMISPVSAGGGFTRTGIGTIVDMDSLEIEVDVNEAFINRVLAGQRVVATLDAYNSWQIPGSVINIVPTADRQRATVKVRIAFDELDSRILPDMGVKVSFLENQTAVEPDGPKVLATVPATALRDENGQDYVWLVRDQKLERRAVRVGPAQGSRVSIVAGLSPGDRVVTAATVQLQEGMKVDNE